LHALWRDDCETVDEQMNAALDMWSEHPYAEGIRTQCRVAVAELPRRASSGRAVYTGL